MKPLKTLPVLTLITLAALTGCGNTPNNDQASTYAVEASPTSEATSSYLELDGAPGLTQDSLEPEDQQAVKEARAANKPLYIKNDQVFWLQPDISYAERVLVESEARKDTATHGIRSVEGFGTGELTFYRHETQPYTLTTHQ